jgi:hypothetical protein
MITIDLDSPQGNAFYLLGLARKLSKARGDSPKDIKAIQARMTHGDYWNLVQEFAKEYRGLAEVYFNAEFEEEEGV